MTTRTANRDKAYRFLEAVITEACSLAVCAVCAMLLTAAYVVYVDYIQSPNMKEPKHVSSINAQ